MIKPAQLYAMEITAKWRNVFYDDEYKWAYIYPGVETINISDYTANEHTFASLNKDNEVIGFISYNVDWVTMTANNFTAINFDKGNLIFARDLYQVACNIFEKFGLNRLMWSVIVGNSVQRAYEHFAKKHGGRECGYLRQDTRLQDGKLYDRVLYEIIAEDYFRAKWEKMGTGAMLRNYKKMISKMIES